MSDEMIIRHCSPTLAGVKTGNLFNCPCNDKEKLLCFVRSLNQRLMPKGVRIIPLKMSEGRVLLYIFRPNRLENDLQDVRISELLKTYGYCVNSPGKCVVQLGRRICESKEFPHEIGLFLGYPLEDVRGFIENHAEGYKCVGCWKVYGDEENARKAFRCYQKCTDAYCSLWKQGITIERLTVAG